MKVSGAGVAVLTAVWYVMVGVLSGATFYVDPVNGDMGNDGSVDRPWRTVQEVFEGKFICTHDGSGRVKNPDGPVKAGDTILLRSGYHGEIYCRGACNDEWITIAADVGHTPKVKRVFFSTAKKWVVRGLTISPSFASEYKQDRMIYVVNWGGESSDFVIEDNVLYSAGDAAAWSAKQWNSRVCYGISVIGKRIVIRNNDLKYVNHGISISGDKIMVQGNHIEHIAGDGIVCSADNASLLYNTMKHFYNVNANHDDGIQFHRGRDKLTPVLNAVVRGNRVIAWDGTVNNPLIHSPQGICNFDIPAINWRIENNIVLVRHHHGITINGCRDGAIVNNIAYNPYGGPFLAGIALGTTHGKTPSERTVVRNNLVDSEISCPPESNTVDHNIMVKDAARYFVNPAKYDMRHKKGSPAINAGAGNLAPKVDIDGVKRPQGSGFDVGPYEYKPRHSISQ